MDSCPNELLAFDRAHRNKVIEQNALMHLQGMYFSDSLRATVGNMFKKKSSKPFEYPKKPYELNIQNEFTEEELQKQRELFVAKLMAMQTNFELSHKDSKVS